jgi:hypothetical protein
MSAQQVIQQFTEYCLENKYSKWYFSIVESALNRGWTKKTAPIYVENHHILPKSIFKNNNIVCLTAREHFICHLLLPKMMKSNEHRVKMIYALTAMRFNGKRNIKINSIYFEKIKEKNLLKGIKKSENTKIKMSISRKKMLKENTNVYNKLINHLNEIRPDQSGKNNPMYGRKNILSPFFNKPKTKEHRLKIKKSLTGQKYTEERCKNMSLNCPKNSLGKKWYHNPIEKIEKYFYVDTQPQNFILGRLPK